MKVTNDCSRQVHIVPTNDLIEHDIRYWNSCLCGPAVTMHKHQDGNDIHFDAIVTHHSLDGRENHEQHLPGA